MKEIYNKNGEIIDYSDEGSEVSRIEADIDYQLLFKRLSKRQLRMLNLKEQGFSGEEIATKLKLSRRTIQSEIAHIKRLCGILK